MARLTLAYAMPVIDTPRLTLVPLPLDEAEALVHGHRPATANWADDYPTEGTLVAASMIIAAEAEGRPLGDFTIFQIRRRDNTRAIGGCGFMLGPPNSSGHVHIGFSMVPSERLHGYEAEAVGAMVTWARKQPDVTRVLAETACTNVDGIAVYQAAGMRRAGSDGDLVHFEG